MADLHRTNIHLHTSDVVFLVNHFGYGWTGHIRELVHREVGRIRDQRKVPTRMSIDLPTPSILDTQRKPTKVCDPINQRGAPTRTGSLTQRDREEAIAIEAVCKTQAAELIHQMNTNTTRLDGFRPCAPIDLDRLIQDQDQ